MNDGQRILANRGGIAVAIGRATADPRMRSAAVYSERRDAIYRARRDGARLGTAGKKWRSTPREG